MGRSDRFWYDFLKGKKVILCKQRENGHTLVVTVHFSSFFQLALKEVLFTERFQFMRSDLGNGNWGEGKDRLTHFKILN